MGFSGFPDEALIFYEGLVADNSKGYWAANKALYDSAVKEPMLALMDELAPEFGAPHLFRPNRDVRFSKDKSPYKTHQGAYVQADLSGVGYYVQLDAEGLYVAGGWWAGGDQILRYREALDDEAAGERLERVIASLPPELTVGGDRLKTRPRGAPEDHPRLELLKHKSLHAGRRFEPELWLGTPETVDRVRATWRSLTPLVDWLRVHLS
ncbi:TIGR02453 family protein [Planotetraspora thailandica]|uniref:TIGR02453 family protein n=1 Tax=Planotetraspora thailandica TaxID=487172 RepID=A0A8J3V1P8_9ACTN|nr:DUF2461 domain-containing protein [Planotetraspora thailandica]GII55682.1 TIGR02453 family protein [Planotetraspora thailandica]